MVQPVGLDYLRSLPLPNTIEELSYDTILEERITEYARLNPAWNRSQDSILYKVAVAESFREYTMRQQFNQRIRGSLLPYAGGSTLRHIALLEGVGEYTGTDNDLTLHIVNRSRRSASTEEGIIAIAKTGPVSVADATVQFSETTVRNYTVFLLKKDFEDLTAAERVEMSLFLSRLENKFLGANVSLGTVMHTALNIAVTVSYYPEEIDAPTLLMDTRRAIYNWIDANARLGNTIHRENLKSAATVERAEFATVQMPPNEMYAGAKDTIYEFQKTDAGVSITLQTLTAA